ncbi:hypothetical protein FOZ60_012586 [Perkinsus olseni]|uniref:Uncharacterized protein n=1 Tax=Perkinsus olseni TaxID=32597 RepID=A0A7J6NBA8_PEROL|nr:hypothetical protein FOZ60_012586 [Perkinsus olseni]
MSTKQLTTVASAAVALVSNLPLGNSIGTSALQNDFIPLVETHIGMPDNRIVCKHERGKKNADDWEVLGVHVSKGFGTASLESWGEVAGRKESGGQVPGKKLNDSDEIPEEVGSDEIPEEVGSDEIPEEDFIPLVSSEISTRDRRYVCKHERGKEYTAGWESLDVHVLKGIGVRTRYIACPKTNKWDAFRIQL